MQKFLVLYMAPASMMEDWMKKPEAERKTEEQKMQSDWKTWMTEHTSMMTGMTAGTGKTKRITKDGTTDVKNDIMLYSVVEADSHDAAAKIFESHPHFGIPGATIELMPINPLPGMA